MKTNNKLLLFLIIFIAIFLFLTLDCFALTGYNDDFSRTIYNNFSSEDKLNYIKELSFFNNDEVVNLKYVFLCSSDYFVTLYFSDYPFKVSQLNSGSSASLISGLGTIYYYRIYFEEQSKLYAKESYNYGSYTILPQGSGMGTSEMLETLSINHDLTYVDSNDIAISREDCNDPFPPITLTLEEVLEKGYQTASETTQQSMTAQIVEILPVGIIILATMIVVSLIAYFRFWRQ